VFQARCVFVTFAAWRAPETFQESAEQIASFKTDVYMFGGVMIEILTGERPWHWLDGNSLYRLRLTTSRNPLEDAVAASKLKYIVDSAETYSMKHRVLVALEQLMARCLSADPDKRPDIPEVSAILTELMKDGGYR
jgi:serine/threonine protein kinase